MVGLVAFDVFCGLMVVAGLLVAFRTNPQATEGQVYARRIGGVMLAVFGLALGVMFTTYSLAWPA